MEQFERRGVSRTLRLLREVVCDDHHAPEVNAAATPSRGGVVVSV
jgi:hypothetical protein